MSVEVVFFGCGKREILCRGEFTEVGGLAMAMYVASL